MNNASSIGDPPDPDSYAGEAGWLGYWLDCLVFLASGVLRGASEIVRYIATRATARRR